MGVSFVFISIPILLYIYTNTWLFVHYFLMNLSRCITVRYITPLRYHFIETRKLPLLARNILKQLDDLQLSSHPIFFHVFSNGGAHTYSYLLKELTTASYNVPLDIKGTVFDSAPCPRKLQTSYRAMLSIFSHLKS